MLCCRVVCVWGGGGGVLVRSFWLYFGWTHTPYNQQGPNEGPTWGCLTASQSYSRAGCR